ncbi:hypothetical protein BDY24DRAFT_428003 [Mrakia frigida]|uniref:uncharacterized protein n=1 Tax=Mrakia frigida TaxID=29902 RepID=UPI003FCC068E
MTFGRRRSVGFFVRATWAERRGLSTHVESLALVFFWSLDLTSPSTTPIVFSMSFNGSTRLEVITVLSRTTTTRESLDEALRCLITYIESKKKRGKRSSEEVSSKLESLEERFAPYGLAFIFHRARLLSGLNASSIPAVRDAGAQRISSSLPAPSAPSSTSSGSTILPPLLSNSPSMSSISADSTGTIPFMLPDFKRLHRRPTSPVETFASSFRDREGEPLGRSSNEWVFSNSSPETDGSGGSGDWAEGSRSGLATDFREGRREDQFERDEKRVQSREVDSAEDEVRRHVEEKIRALQLVLDQIGPTSPSKPAPPPRQSSYSGSVSANSSNLPLSSSSSRQRSRSITSSNSSSSRLPSLREPPTERPPRDSRQISHSSYNPSLFSDAESATSSRSSSYIASSSSPSFNRTAPPRSNSTSSGSHPHLFPPTTHGKGTSRALPSLPPSASRIPLGLGLSIPEGEVAASRKSRFARTTPSRTSSSEHSPSGWSAVSSRPDSLPSYETVLEHVVADGEKKRARGETRIEAAVRPDNSPTLGWGSFA